MTRALEGSSAGAGPSPDQREVLAAFGGIPVRTSPFPAWPMVTDEVRAAILAVVESGHWWQAEWHAGQVEELERALASRFAVNSCIAVMNGTAALELAFAALDLGPGDEVLVPATTFISTATAVTAVGARPVPVDVKRDTLGLDVASAAERISDRTRAIVPVHISGNPTDLNAVTELAAAAGLVVIEDAAQAFGTEWHGRLLGSFGDLAILSLQAGKLLPAGEGGAVLVRSDAALQERVYELSHCGVRRGGRWYDHQTVGSNRRMTEFQAAAALAQLGQVKRLGRVRAEAVAALTAAVDAGGLGTPMRVAAGTTVLDPSAFWLWLPGDLAGRASARVVAELLSAEGVPAAPMYPAWHRTPAYGGGPRTRDDHCPVAERATNEAVWFHHRMFLDGARGVGHIVQALRKVLFHLRHS